MILKVLRPEEPHEKTTYGDVIKVREVPPEGEPYQEGEGRVLEVEFSYGETRHVFYEPGFAFLMNDDGNTIDRF